MAQFLDTTFAFIDIPIARGLLDLSSSVLGEFITETCKFISLLGEKGIIFFALSIALMFFTKTRKLGVCIFGSVTLGAILTNLILKDIIARPRPFWPGEYYDWGYPIEDGYSFPSGHVTAISAAMFVVFLMCNKKWSWIGFPLILLMGFARIYLMAHYFTDVIAGIMVGVLSGTIAYFITKLIYYYLNKYKDKKFCNFVLFKGFTISISDKQNQDNNKKED